MVEVEVAAGNSLGCEEAAGAGVSTAVGEDWGVCLTASVTPVATARDAAPTNTKADILNFIDSEVPASVSNLFYTHRSKCNGTVTINCAASYSGLFPKFLDLSPNLCKARNDEKTEKFQYRCTRFDGECT